MSASQPVRISTALLIGEMIRELEQKRDAMLAAQETHNRALKEVNRQLDVLWLEVGRLKHASGE